MCEVWLWATVYFPNQHHYNSYWQYLWSEGVLSVDGSESLAAPVSSRQEEGCVRVKGKIMCNRDLETQRTPAGLFYV